MLLISPGSIRIWLIGGIGRKTHTHTPELDVELGSLVSAVSVNRLSEANNGESKLYSIGGSLHTDVPVHRERQVRSRDATEIADLVCPLRARLLKAASLSLPHS